MVPRSRNGGRRRRPRLAEVRESVRHDSARLGPGTEPGVGQSYGKTVDQMPKQEAKEIWSAEFDREETGSRPLGSPSLDEVALLGLMLVLCVVVFRASNSTARQLRSTFGLPRSAAPPLVATYVGHSAGGSGSSYRSESTSFLPSAVTRSATACCVPGSSSAWV